MSALTQPKFNHLSYLRDFSKKNIHMNLITAVFPHVEVCAAYVTQASALGATLAIHKHWNKKPVLSDLIGLKISPDATKDMEVS